MTHIRTAKLRGKWDKFLVSSLHCPLGLAAYNLTHCEEKDLM